jgi:hypothetical protein
MHVARRVPDWRKREERKKTIRRCYTMSSAAFASWRGRLGLTIVGMRRFTEATMMAALALDFAILTA